LGGALALVGEGQKCLQGVIEHCRVLKMVRDPLSESLFLEFVHRLNLKKNSKYQSEFMALFCGLNLGSVPGFIFCVLWFFKILCSYFRVTIRGLDMFSGASFDK
jgi:hypothetical protein